MYVIVSNFSCHLPDKYLTFYFKANLQETCMHIVLKSAQNFEMFEWYICTDSLYSVGCCVRNLSTDYMNTLLIPLCPIVS